MPGIPTASSAYSVPSAPLAECAQRSTRVMYAIGMSGSDAKRLYLVADAPCPIPSTRRIRAQRLTGLSVAG
jgi:hypothetical protein